MKYLLLIVLLTSTSWAAGPRFKQKEPDLQQEIENIYQDIRSVSVATADPLTIGKVIVSTITASSATITNATITNLTVGTLTTSGILGNLFQTRMITTTGNTSTTSTSYQDTPLIVPITPGSASATRCILLLASANGFDNTGAFQTYITLTRDTTNLIGAVGFANNVTAGTNQNPGNGSFIFVDCPLTTSAVYYKTQVRTSNASGTARSNAQGNTQSLIAMEITYP